MFFIIFLSPFFYAHKNQTIHLKAVQLKLETKLKAMGSTFSINFINGIIFESSLLMKLYA